jgi:hypothetical protein
LLRSQSAKMIRGDFPPSSRETFFTLLRAQLQGTEGWGWCLGALKHRWLLGQFQRVRPGPVPSTHAHTGSIL